MHAPCQDRNPLIFISHNAKPGEPPKSGHDAFVRRPALPDKSVKLQCSNEALSSMRMKGHMNGGATWPPAAFPRLFAGGFEESCGICPSHIGKPDISQLSKNTIICIYRLFRYLAMTRLSTPHQAGQILSARRKTLGLSQAAASASLGISQNRLSELEAHPDRLTLERLMSLASLLGLELVIQEKTPAANESEW
jgi:HTH-type transcriptional regulator/antitoxin HipB